jgi:hypothetical protein
MNSIKERIGMVVGDGHSMNAAAAITKIVLQILARLEISRNSVALKFHLSSY